MTARSALGEPAGSSTRIPIPLIAGAAVLSGLVSLVLAQAGVVGLLAAGGLGGLALALFLVRKRELLVLLVMIASLQFLFHKSIGPIVSDISGGAPSIYITSFDLMLVILYALWIASGELRRDLATIWGKPLFMLPLVAIASTLPSLLAASDLTLGLSEIVRMMWMYGLFVYVALRVRTRRELALVVGVLFLVVIAQFAVAALQWRTGSSLGLEVLGEQDTLGVRSLDGTNIARPSGTVIHPDFLAALVAPIALLAFALAVEIRRGPWIRSGLLAMTAVGSATLLLSQARAAMVGFGVGLLLLGSWYVIRRQIPMRVVAVAGGVVLFIALLFGGPIADQLLGNFGTDHFQLEIDSRVELNDLALGMIADQPIVGVGLNNFEQAMGAYDKYGLLFADNPVHNLYLLIATETGIIGAIGFSLSAGIIAITAARAAMLPSGLLGGTGAAVAATVVFFAVEELLTFSLRHDMPLAIFWLLAGLAVACLRMDRREREPALAAS